MLAPITRFRRDQSQRSTSIDPTKDITHSHHEVSAGPKPKDTRRSIFQKISRLNKFSEPIKKEKYPLPTRGFGVTNDKETLRWIFQKDNKTKQALGAIHIQILIPPNILRSVSFATCNQKALFQLYFSKSLFRLIILVSSQKKKQPTQCSSFQYER